MLMGQLTIIESVDSICRDSTDAQYMIIPVQRNLSTFKLHSNVPSWPTSLLVGLGAAVLKILVSRLLSKVIAQYLLLNSVFKTTSLNTFLCKIIMVLSNYQIVTPHTMVQTEMMCPPCSGGTCDPTNGMCLFPPGFTGINCSGKASWDDTL